MATAASTTPAGFDPRTQTITLLASDGSSIPIAISDIDAYVFYGVRICINYSSQIGASIILLACLFLLTAPTKRQTPIFIINALALFFNIIRSIAQCIYFTGPFNEFYNYFSGDYSTIPTSQIGASITGIVFTLLLVICLEASLVLQVRVMLATPTVRPLHRHITLIIAYTVALAAIGFRLALAIQNSRAVAAIVSFDQIWLAKTSTYVTTASICFFSAIFVAKLAVALRRRRKMLAMQGWGPMEIVFVMGCQTMIVPAIFAVLQNFTQVPELGSQMLTVTAIFLPLSSLWAAASVENKTSAKVDAKPANGGKVRKGVFAKMVAAPARRLSVLAAGKIQLKELDLESGTEPMSANTLSTFDKGHTRTESGTSASESEHPQSAKVDAKNAKDGSEADDLDNDLKMYVGRDFGRNGDRTRL